MTAAIFTAEDKFHPHPELPALSPPERILARFWPAFSFAGLPEGLDTQHPAYAQVRQGRWVVECPNPQCPAAQLASRQDHRFFCVTCENFHVGNQWVPVLWPDDWREIEAVLGRRPVRSTRNWLPGETVELLRDENREHGVAA